MIKDEELVSVMQLLTDNIENANYATRAKFRYDFLSKAKKVSKHLDLEESDTTRQVKLVLIQTGVIAVLLTICLLFGECINGALTSSIGLWGSMIWTFISSVCYAYCVAMTITMLFCIIRTAIRGY